MALKRCSSSWRSWRRSLAASKRRISSGVVGVRGATEVGLPLSLTATMVKKQLLACLTTWLRMFSAITFTPISMELLPV